MEKVAKSGKWGKHDFPYPWKRRFFWVNKSPTDSLMVTMAFFLEGENAVRPITMLKVIRPRKGDRYDNLGSTVVGSKSYSQPPVSPAEMSPNRGTKWNICKQAWCRITRKCSYGISEDKTESLITYQKADDTQRDRTTAWQGLYKRVFKCMAKQFSWKEPRFLHEGANTADSICKGLQ